MLATDAPVRSVILASLEHKSCRMVAVNIAYCSLGGSVLNLLRMGENQNILFLLVRKACVWTIRDATKKKKKKHP